MAVTTHKAVVAFARQYRAVSTTLALDRDARELVSDVLFGIDQCAAQIQLLEQVIERHRAVDEALMSQLRRAEKQAAAVRATEMEKALCAVRDIVHNVLR